MTESESKREIRPGRGWAYVATFLGLAVSLAANVAHSFVPPVDAPEGWTPHVGSILLALVWPIAVYVVIEVFARALRRDLTWWTVMRYIALAPVALVAAIVSYNHLSALMLFYGETHFVSTIGPLGIDGLMIMGTGALIAVSRPRNLKNEKPDLIDMSQTVELTREDAERLEIAIPESPVVPSLRKPVRTVQVTVRPTTERAPSRSRLEQVEIVKANIPDWDTREVKGQEITMITGIKGAESIQKIKDVLYPDSPTALRRAAKREAELAHSA